MFLDPLKWTASDSHLPTSDMEEQWTELPLYFHVQHGKVSDKDEPSAASSKYSTGETTP